MCPIRFIGGKESMGCGYYSREFKEMEHHIKEDHHEWEYLDAILNTIKKNGKQDYDEWDWPL